MCIEWNPNLGTQNVRPISCNIARGCPLLEAKMYGVRCVETQTFVLVMEVFSTV